MTAGLTARVKQLPGALRKEFLGFFSPLRRGVRLLWRFFRKFPGTAMIGIVTLALCAYLIKEALLDIVVVDDVSVPKHYEEMGFTSTFVAWRVADDLNQMEKDLVARAAKTDLIQAQELKDIPDIQVPATNLSIRVLVDACRHILNREVRHYVGRVAIVWSKRTRKQPPDVELWANEHTDSNQQLITHQVLQSTDPEQFAKVLAEDFLSRLNPYFWSLYLLQAKHDPMAALVTAQKLLKSTQSTALAAKAHNVIGVVYSQQNKFDLAVQEYQKAINADPNFSPPYTNWGRVLNERHEYDQALKKNELAAKIDPSYALAYNNWGVSLDGKGETDAAIAKFRKAIALDQKFAAAYANLGSVLLRNSEILEATKALQKALALDPTNNIDHDLLGSAYMCSGKLVDAIIEFRTATHEKPEDGNAHLGLTIALTRSGNKLKANEEFLLARKLVGTLPHTYRAFAPTVRQGCIVKVVE